MVEDVESLGHQLRSGLFRQLELTAQAHVKSNVIWAYTRVATSSRRTIIGGMAVVVDVGPGQQIERMRAVVTNKGSELKTRKNAIPPGAFEDGCKHDFVTL